MKSVRHLYYADAGANVQPVLHNEFTRIACGSARLQMISSPRLQAHEALVLGHSLRESDGLYPNIEIRIDRVA